MVVVTIQAGGTVSLDVNALFAAGSACLTDTINGDLANSTQAGAGAVGTDKLIATDAGLADCAALTGGTLKGAFQAQEEASEGILKLVVLVRAGVHAGSLMQVSS